MSAPRIEERAGFRIVTRGVADRPIVAEYICPTHGRYSVSVDRDENGDAPAAHICACGEAAEFAISAPAGRVKRFEAVRGKWEKPERKTFLDTRNLGEGQDVDDWRKDREAIRDEQRRQSLKELMND